MNEENKERLITAGVILIIVLMFVGLFSFMWWTLQQEYKTVRGTIADIEIVMNDNGKVDHYIFTFDDGTIIEAISNSRRYDSEYYDFTKGSELIVEFSRNKNFDKGEYWDIKSIIKVPVLE